MQTTAQSSLAPTARAITCALLMLLLTTGCGSQSSSRSAETATPGAPSASAAQVSTDCKVDSAKICADAQSAGTLEQGPPMGYGGPSMVDIARLAIPGGPSIQAMCYYDPQHKSLSRSDWSSSAPLDANAIAFLKSKGDCK